MKKSKEKGKVFCVHEEDVINYGAHTAIVLYHLRWWLSQNKVNKRNIIDGRVWSSNSVSNWSEYFTCLTNDQVRRAFERAEKAGIVLSRKSKIESDGRSKMYTIDEPEFIFESPHNEQEMLAELPNIDTENEQEMLAELPNRNAKNEQEMLAELPNILAELPNNSAELPNPYYKETVLNTVINTVVQKNKNSLVVDGTTSFKGKGGIEFNVTLPDELNNQEFCTSYQEYLDHYADQYKRFKSVMMVEKDFIELARLKSRGNDVIEVINRTIRSGGYEFYDLPRKDEPVKEVRGSGPNWGLM